MNGDILTTMDMKKMYDYACQESSMFVAAIKEIIMPYAFGRISFSGNQITYSLDESVQIVLP